MVQNRLLFKEKLINNRGALKLIRSNKILQEYPQHRSAFHNLNCKPGFSQIFYSRLSSDLDLGVKECFFCSQREQSSRLEYIQGGGWLVRGMWTSHSIIPVSPIRGFDR